MEARNPIYRHVGALLSSGIQEHHRWLQEAPRTTRDLLEHLDLPVAYPWSKDGSGVQRINEALWDAGYTPHPADERNPRWYWLEGKLLNSHQ